MLYPGTALTIVAPFAAVGGIEAHAARVVFTVLGACTLTFLLTRDGYGRLPLLLSYSFLSALSLGQWTPWLAAAALAPTLGFLAAAKPNVGLAVLAGVSNRRSLTRMVAGCGLLLLVSLAILPSWPVSWLDATRHAPANVPLVTILPAGPLLLLSLLRWRRRDARMLAALALVPQNPVPHAAVIMFSAPWRWWESLILSALSWIVVPLVYRPGVDVRSYSGFARAMGSATIMFVFLPMVVTLLARPNREDGDPTCVGRSRRAETRCDAGSTDCAGHVPQG